MTGHDAQTMPDRIWVSRDDAEQSPTWWTIALSEYDGHIGYLRADRVSETAARRGGTAHCSFCGNVFNVPGTEARCGHPRHNVEP
jgi:hypothetical protein